MCIRVDRRQSGYGAQVRHVRAHGRHGVLAKDRFDHGQRHSVPDVPVFGDHRLRRTPKRSVPITIDGLCPMNTLDVNLPSAYISVRPYNADRYFFFQYRRV